MKYLIGWWNKDIEWVEKELNLEDMKIFLTSKEIDSVVGDVYLVKVKPDEQS